MSFLILHTLCLYEGMSALAQPCQSYQRRSPELTPCYQIVQQHMETFIAERQDEGRPLPAYAIKELEAFLECGIPAHGFLRLKCQGCHAEKIVSFSCKRRGFCPSCAGKRMAEAAAHLVDNVLPYVPYRQFVISFPFPMRFWLNSNMNLYDRVHAIVIDTINNHYVSMAEEIGIKDPKPGTISFCQRFGSALNLNPHFHILAIDGVYTTVNGQPVFRKVDAITNDQVASLVTKISQKALEYLRQLELLDHEDELIANPHLDAVFEEHATLTQATASSITGKVAFGDDAGKKVNRMRSKVSGLSALTLMKGKRCYSANGFNLHANTAINTQRRDRLENLIQYVARGPLANDRIEITDDGNIVLRLKSQWSCGTSHISFSPSDFISRLVALIPRPKVHLVRWGGVFAPNSALRKLIVLDPEKKKGFQPHNCEDPKLVKNHTWSKMLARIFKLEVATCECGDDFRIIAALSSPQQVKRYLDHVGIPSLKPARAPPVPRAEYFEFDQTLHYQHEEPVIYID